MNSKVLISQKDLKNLRSGVPRLVLSEAKYLKSLDIFPLLVSETINPDFQKHLGTKSIQKTFRWPFSGFKRRLFYMRQVEKKIKKLNPDVVIGHGDIINQDICFIHNCVHLAYEKIHGKKIPRDHEVARIHEMILQKKQFKVLVCNSHMMKNDLESRFDLKDKEVVVQYPDFSPKGLANHKENIRNELQIGDDEIVIGLITSGNFKKRNVKFLLEVMAKIKTEKKLIVIITGKDKAEPYKELAHKLAFPVHFLPTIDDVTKYYNTCDIFILPALIEEFGLSVLEAMACEKPVIVSPTVGCSEIFQGETKNYILELKHELYTSKIQTLINDNELRKSLGEHNKELAFSLSSENQNNKFRELLAKVNFII